MRPSAVLGPVAVALQLLLLPCCTSTGAALQPAPAPRAQLQGARRTVNLTLYRVTPVNLTGVADRNTGDDAGDVFFTLYEAMLPVYCPQNPSDSICNITSSVLGDTQRNVYRQSLVEVDANFGIYNGCNPQANGTVDCGAYLRGPMCWFNASCGGSASWAKYGGAIGPFCSNSSTPAGSKLASQKFKKSFEGLCDPAKCACAAAFSESVGTWPAVFSRPDAGPPHQKTVLWAQINALSTTLQGNWYSTLGEGECGAGERPGVLLQGGRRCFWRELRVLRNANASCVRSNFLAAVKKHAHSLGCYEACPQPSNTTSACYVQCMLTSITAILPGGGAAKGLQPMGRRELLAAFTRSFRTEDAAEGGCPEGRAP